MHTADDRQRARALARMRLFATGLLVLMFVVFLTARTGEAAYPWLGYVRAFTEAAMVGGLADWFAVTALFRHPLGLPIPHTAIIPRNQRRIADGVGAFVADNFLCPDVVLPKTRALDPAGRLADWLARPGGTRLVARRIALALPPLLAAVADQPVAEMLRRAAADRLRAIDAVPLLARLLEALTAQGHHMVLFDVALAAGRRFITENEEEIHRMVGARSGRWVPDWLDARLSRRLAAAMLAALEDLRAADHPWRQRFDQAARGWGDRLAHSPQARARAAALQEALIGHPDSQALLRGLWREAKQALLDDVAKGERVERLLERTVAGLAQRLAQDPQLRDLVNGWASLAVARLVVPHRQRLGDVMAGVVRGWDTPTLIAKLELQVGRDLQYIRLNGTLVGGLVGLALHALPTVSWLP